MNTMNNGSNPWDRKWEARDSSKTNDSFLNSRALLYENKGYQTKIEEENGYFRLYTLEPLPSNPISPQFITGKWTGKEYVIYARNSSFPPNELLIAWKSDDGKWCGYGAGFKSNWFSTLEDATTRIDDIDRISFSTSVDASSREKYQVACERAGLTSLTDAEISDRAYGLTYGEFTLPEYSANSIIENSLARQRLKQIEVERKTKEMENMVKNTNIHFSYFEKRVENEDGLLFFLTHAYIGCGDKEVSDFLRFSGLTTDNIWRELKEKSVYIGIHVGDSFNHVVPENQEWARLDSFDADVCEKETVKDAGHNYVSSFHVRKSDLISRWQREWMDFKQVEHLPRITFYSHPDGYVLDEDKKTFLQSGNEYTAIGWLYDGMLLVRRNKDNHLLIRRPMDTYNPVTKSYDANPLDVPHLVVDENLKGILSTIEGSCSTGHSILEIYLLLSVEILEKIEPDDTVLQHFQGYHENIQVESFRCAKGIISTVTYRSAIDDYDIQVFLNNEILHSTETQQYDYDTLLGLIKKEE